MTTITSGFFKPAVPVSDISFTSTVDFSGQDITDVSNISVSNLTSTNATADMLTASVTLLTEGQAFLNKATVGSTSEVAPGTDISLYSLGTGSLSMYDTSTITDISGYFGHDNNLPTSTSLVISSRRQDAAGSSNLYFSNKHNTAYEHIGLISGKKSASLVGSGGYLSFSGSDDLGMIVEVMTVKPEGTRIDTQLVVGTVTNQAVANDDIPLCCLPNGSLVLNGVTHSNICAYFGNINSGVNSTVLIGSTKADTTASPRLLFVNSDAGTYELLSGIRGLRSSSMVGTGGYLALSVSSDSANSNDKIYVKPNFTQFGQPIIVGSLTETAPNDDIELWALSSGVLSTYDTSSITGIAAYFGTHFTTTPTTSVIIGSATSDASCETNLYFLNKHTSDYEALGLLSGRKLGAGVGTGGYLGVSAGDETGSLVEVMRIMSTGAKLDGQTLLGSVSVTASPDPSIPLYCISDGSISLNGVTQNNVSSYFGNMNSGVNPVVIISSKKSDTTARPELLFTNYDVNFLTHESLAGVRGRRNGTVQGEGGYLELSTSSNSSTLTECMRISPTATNIKNPTVLGNINDTIPDSSAIPLYSLAQGSLSVQGASTISNICAYFGPTRSGTDSNASIVVGCDRDTAGTASVYFTNRSESNADFETLAGVIVSKQSGSFGTPDPSMKLMLSANGSSGGTVDSLLLEKDNATFGTTIYAPKVNASANNLASTDLISGAGLVGAVTMATSYQTYHMRWDTTSNPIASNTDAVVTVTVTANTYNDFNKGIIASIASYDETTGGLPVIAVGSHDNINNTYTLQLRNVGGGSLNNGFMILRIHFL